MIWPNKATSRYSFKIIRQGRQKLLTSALILAATLAFGALSPTVGLADQVMPDFSTASDWVIDRYAPHSFSDVGTYNGRNHVLAIEINSAEGLINRAETHQDSSWYNTQGRDHPISSGGVGSVLSADLYIPASWSNADNGSVRTDMWGVMTDGTSINSDYNIIGFTNYNGAARYQIFDGDAGGWIVITDTPVTYDSWNTLAIQFTGASYIYSINGNSVYIDTSIHGSIGFSWVDMQAYNFYDPSLTGANPVDYTAYWSNTPTQTPIPGSVLLLGSALFALGLLSWPKFFKR